MDTSDATDQGAPSGRIRRTAGVPEVKPGDTLADRFLLREILGHGATGTVFSALDRSVGQKVAIKVLHPDLHDERTRERLRREVRASRNGHPNAVAVYDLHEAEGNVFLSMELVEGRSLKDLLTERKNLDPSEVVAIGRQVAAALAHLHGLGIIHRDIKPGNILLACDGTVKLCDMGLARPIEEGMTVTETEMVVGTPAYMAPEQGLGADLTTASDVYGLGLTLYQCLTGSVPLTSETAVATLTRRQRERPPAVRRERPDCPSWLNRLIRRMLEPRPGDRPPATKVVAALETGRVWPRPRRRTAAAAGAAFAVSVAAFLLGPRLLTRETVRFEVGPAEVHGVDATGRVTWTHDLPAPITSAEPADLDGDGRDEIVVAGRPDRSPEGRDVDPTYSFLTVLTRTGELMTRIVPEERLADWNYPFRLDLNPIPFILDIDGDGRHEIILLCQHTRFYPAVLMLYWPRWDLWERLLDHPGHIYAMGAASRDGSPGLGFVAVNNLLAMVFAYGEIEIVSPASRQAQRRSMIGFGAPPDAPLIRTSVGSWRAYVPLDSGEHGQPKSERISIDHISPDIRVRMGLEGCALDPFYNPVPGPNAGRDLQEARLDFMSAMFLLSPGRGAISSDGTMAFLEATRSNAGSLMEEPSYEVIFDVIGARALATAGDLEAAIALLESAGSATANEDLPYRLGHLQAVAGRFDASKATITQLIDTGWGPRSRFDATLLMLQLALRTRDSDKAQASISYLVERDAVGANQSVLTSALWARVRLWWDESTDADCAVRSVDLDADGDAVGCLARWRTHQNRGNDVQFMEASNAINTDGSKLGRVALAAALMAGDRASEALAELDRLIAELEPGSRYDFVDREVLDLARAVRATALLDSGDSAAARNAARQLAPHLGSGTLPEILVLEVLDRTANSFANAEATISTR